MGTDGSVIVRRPLLRGYFHLVAAWAAVVGLVVLVLRADSPRAYVGGVIFAASMALLYATSAAYHTMSWGRRMRSLLRRLDHAMIFVLIAGTYTPFCLLAASRAWGVSLLAVAWSVAGAGVIMKLAWPGAPRWLSVLLYGAAGWMALVASVPLAQWLAFTPLAALVAGGILYTVGGVIYALRRPDPFPRVFGYHEVFHLLVVGASALHYSIVVIYLMPG